MHRYVHRTGVGVIAWRQGATSSAAGALAPADRHRRLVSRGRVVRVAAGYGVVVGAGNASGSFAALSLAAPTATATGKALATGSLDSISLTSPTATASSTGAGVGNAFGSFDAITLVAPTGTASGAASASGSLDAITLVAPSATAQEVAPAVYVPGARVGRTKARSTSRPSRIANTTR